MNVFEKIQSMNIDEFAKWLDEHGEFDGSPWMKWWDKNYCNKCELVVVDPQDDKLNYYFSNEYSWCELNDDKCKFFMDMDKMPTCDQVVKLWLESEVKLTSEEFTWQYCKNCGSQRCDGIESQWFEGCKYKDNLEDNM